MEIKRIDFTKDVIPANGKEYKIISELPIARFKQLDEMEVEFFYGFDMKGMFDKLKESFDYLNKNKIADASVRIHNLMKGIADKVDKREPVMLRMCSLFLVTEDEDITTWSDELCKQKVEDWQKEGYAMSDFFSLVATLLPGYLQSYEEVTQNTSQKTQEKEDVEAADSKKKQQKS